MKKILNKILSTFLFPATIAVIVMVVFSGNNTLKAQNQLAKETIYTLEDGEKLGSTENSMGVYGTKLGYLLVIENDKKDARKYIFNNQTYGTYNRKIIEKPQLNDYNWGFADTRGDSSLVVFNGNNEGRFGAGKHTSDLRSTKNLRAYTVYDEATAETKVVINAVEYGPYQNLVRYYLSPEEDTWAVSYYENQGNYYNFFVKFSTGLKIGPFTKIHNFVLLNNEHWIVEAEKKDTPPQKYLIQTHKGDLGLFDKALQGKDYASYSDLIYTNLNFGKNVIKDQKIYYMVNGELFGDGLYTDFIKQVDLGAKLDRFNYVVGNDNQLIFKGEKFFTKNVTKFTISDSRNSVAIVKSQNATTDILNINEKVQVGTFGKITDIAFIPDTENFYFWTKNADNSHTLHLRIGAQTANQGTYKVKPDLMGKMPSVQFTPSMRHWGFVYLSDKNEHKVVVNKQEYDTSFINSVALFGEGREEYATWLSLDKDKIILNKISF